MIITTIENIGREFEPLGLVRGSMIQSKHIGKDITAGFKTLVGGELKGYTEMMISGCLMTCWTLPLSADFWMLFVEMLP